MKRIAVLLLTFLLAVSAIAAVPGIALAASLSALPTQHAGPLSGAGISALRSFAGFSRSGQPSPQLAGPRAFAYGGGSTEASAVELTYPSRLPSGTVDWITQPDDIYWFYMDAGAEMDFSLTPANPGSQLALGIWQDAGSNSLSGSPLVLDTSYTYDHSINFVAPTDGYYLIEIHATTGASTYTMPYVWYYGPNDNTHAATGLTTPVLPNSPVQAWLDQDWDVDDVYRTPLQVGDKLSLNLGALYSYGTSNLNLYLFMLKPGAASVWPHTSSNTDIVGHSVNAAPAANTITYTATTKGDHYVDVAIPIGAGPSDLKWTINPAKPAIARTPSASKLTYKRSGGVAKFTWSARFTNGLGMPVGSRKVYLQTSTNGKTWKSAFTFTTNANGAVKVTISVKKKGVVYFRWMVKNVKGKAVASPAQKVTIK